MIINAHASRGLPAGEGKEISIYYELLIFDRGLITFISNTRILDFDDIFTLGFGLKLAFN